MPFAFASRRLTLSNPTPTREICRSRVHFSMTLRVIGSVPAMIASASPAISMSSISVSFLLRVFTLKSIPFALSISRGNSLPSAKGAVLTNTRGLPVGIFFIARKNQAALSPSLEFLLELITEQVIPAPGSNRPESRSLTAPQAKILP